MKKLIVIILITGLFLMGCMSGKPLETPSPSVPMIQPALQPVEKQPDETWEVERKPCAEKEKESVESYVLKATPQPKPKEAEPEIVLPIQPPSDKTWISPGKVQIGNFQPGNRAEWNLTINAGLLYRQLNFIVITEIEETTASIKLDKPLLDNNMEYVRATYIVPSEEITELPKPLKIEAYNPKDRVLSLSGFLASTKHSVFIEFAQQEQPNRKFRVAYTTPHRVPEGYEMPPAEAQNWVIIVDPTPVISITVDPETKEEKQETTYNQSVGSIEIELKPRTSTEIPIHLVMPKKAKAPDKWEFWISVKDISQGGMVQTELASRWLVNMRVEG